MDLTTSNSILYRCCGIYNSSSMVFLDALLQTKIRIPALRQGLVPRKRLQEQLDSGLSDRLTLISAPAGYGKTTLLCEWIASQSSNLKFAWLALDEGDNNPVIFLQYVIAALQKVDAEIGQSILPALQGPNPPNPVGFLPPLLNQINQRKDKIILIFDDYHLITEQPVHQITEQFIEKGCEGLYVMIATRVDPPLPIYRYRAQGELTEIRQAQLGFTMDETREFLHKTVGDIIPQKDVEFLYQRTEGWVVGLLLAGLSIQEGHVVSESIASLTGNQIYIMEYLVNEVFERQSERIKAFLLKTSILKRLTGPLCDRLTGFEDGYATLEFLKSKNLFVSAIDDEHVWYRYHQLFTDLLRRKLEREMKVDLPKLHKLASEWYVQNDFLGEAIDHAISSDDFVYTSSLIEKYADTIWSRGEHSLLFRQLQRLHPEIISSYAPLCVWYSLLLFFARQYKLAKELLQNAEELVQKDPSSSKQHLRNILGIKALQSAQLALDELDVDHAAQTAQVALEHLQENWKVPRLLTQMIMADALTWQGNTIKASQAYSELLTQCELQNNVYMFYTIALRIPFIACALGRLREAHDFCLDNLQHLSVLKPRLIQLEGIFHIAITQILVEWNQLEESLVHLDTAYSIFEIEKNKPPEDFYSRMVRGYIACNQIPRAKQIIDLVEQAIRESQLPRYDLSLVLAWKARIHLLEDHLSLADEVLAELEPVDCTQIDISDEIAYLCWARVWISRGDYHQAVELLEALQSMIQQGGRTSRLIETFILRAVVEAVQGNLRPAQGYLSRAITLAEPEGFIRIFVEEGAIVRNMLEEISSAGQGSPYIQKLIAAFDSTPEPRHADRKSISLVESFSEREWQVMRLLRTHLSQQEMADELCVSVNTIRFHIKNIYAKLGVHNRSEAVGKARAAGLL